MRYFDTAPHYGLGLSERRLGAALARRPAAEFVVSTKVGRLLRANPAPHSDDLANGFAVPDTVRRVRDYSATGVRASLDESRARLGLDRIGIAFVHDPEQHMTTALTEAVPALRRLCSEGAIAAVGVGMNFVEPLRRFVAAGGIDVIMVAGRWTLLDRSAETLLAECLERGVQVIAAAPFNSGLLARSDPPEDATFDYQRAAPEALDRVRRLARVCRAHGVELPHAAVQFPLRHPAVVSVVAGTRSPTEVGSAARWAAEPLPDDLWADLDRAAAF